MSGSILRPVAFKALCLLFLCCVAVPVAVLAQIPRPPRGTLVINCRLRDAPHTDGKVYVDGGEVGRCPEVKVELSPGTHTVRVGQALGNDRFLAYENEQVEVHKDVTENVTAALVPRTAEESPSLVYAMGARRYSLRMPDDTKTGVFSQDGTVLALGAETNSVQLYDAAEGRALRRLGEPGKYWVSFVSTLAFSADGRLLASSGWLYDKYIGEINIWDTGVGRLIRTIPQVKEVDSLSFSADGKLLAAGVSHNTVQVWSMSDGKLLWSVGLPVDGGKVEQLAFSPDGRLLLSSPQLGQSLYVYDATTSKLLSTLRGKLATFDKDGRALTCSAEGDDAALGVWRLPGGEMVESKRIKNATVARCLNLQTLTTAVGGRSLLDARNEPLMGALNIPNRMRLSPDGRRLLIYGDGGYSLWSLLLVPRNPEK